MPDKVYFVWLKSVGHKVFPAKWYGDRTDGCDKPLTNNVIEKHILSSDLERLDLDTLAKMFPLAA